MRWLVQPAALWIGVVGALAHIAVTAPEHPIGGQLALPCLESLHAAARTCERAGGDRCELSAIIGPHEAVSIAEEVLLGDRAADEVRLRFEPEAGRLVWTVDDRDTSASIDLDAFTGEVVAFLR
jgi:hypothetical protein